MTIQILDGEPALKAFVVNIALACACETKRTLMVFGKPGTIFGCPDCRRVWKIEAVGIDKITGQLDVEMTRVLMPAGVQS
jgi:hypothetical protein